MKHTLHQIFHSGKFVLGFCIFIVILLIVMVYPVLFPYPPLAIIGQGTFFAPGIYVNAYDSVHAPKYTLNLEDAAAKRIASRLSEDDRVAMQEWLVGYGIPQGEIDINDTAQLLGLWNTHYDPKAQIPGLTNAKRNYYIRLDTALEGLLATEDAVIAVKNPETGALEAQGTIAQSDYVNVGQVANVRFLPLGDRKSVV